MRPAFLFMQTGRRRRAEAAREPTAMTSSRRFALGVEEEERFHPAKCA